MDNFLRSIYDPLKYIRRNPPGYREEIASVKKQWRLYVVTQKIAIGPTSTLIDCGWIELLADTKCHLLSDVNTTLKWPHLPENAKADQ